MWHKKFHLSTEIAVPSRIALPTLSWNWNHKLCFWLNLQTYLGKWPQNNCSNLPSSVAVSLLLCFCESSCLHAISRSSHPGVSHPGATQEQPSKLQSKLRFIISSNLHPYCSGFFSLGLASVDGTYIWAMYQVRLQFCHKKREHDGNLIQSKFLIHESFSSSLNLYLCRIDLCEIIYFFNFFLGTQCTGKLFKLRKDILELLHIWIT